MEKRLSFAVEFNELKCVHGDKNSQIKQFFLRFGHKNLTLYFGAHKNRLIMNKIGNKQKLVERCECRNGGSIHSPAIFIFIATKNSTR